MPVKLTESSIAKATREAAEKGDRLELSDATCPGLRLRISPSGRRDWKWVGRDRLNRMRRFDLGDYNMMGLSEARDEARKMRMRVRHEGFDPVLERKRDRAKGKDLKEGKGTLAWLLDEYATSRGNKLKSWSHSRLRVERVFADFLNSPLSLITKKDLQNAADNYHSSNSGAFAVRTLRPVLKWAINAEIDGLKADLALITQPDRAKPRHRVLSADELRRVLPALTASSRPHAKCMLLMLLTLARREEAAGACWGHIDLDARTWVIDDPKNHQKHVIPLSRQATQLLMDVKPKDVKADKLVFATSAGTPLGNWDRETKSIHDRSKTSLWHRHDLRRTGTTMLGEMGVLPDILEACLNHVNIRSPLAATYNRSRYRPQVAEALQRLADALDNIEAGGAAIVPLHANGAAS